MTLHWLVFFSRVHGLTLPKGCQQQLHKKPSERSSWLAGLGAQHSLGFSLVASSLASAIKIASFLHKPNNLIKKTSKI